MSKIIIDITQWPGGISLDIGTDSSFAQGKVGKYIRETFKERSRFEE